MSQPKLDRITRSISSEYLATIRDTDIIAAAIVKALKIGMTTQELIHDEPELDTEDVIQALLWLVIESIDLTNALVNEFLETSTNINGFLTLLIMEDEFSDEDKDGFIQGIGEAAQKQSKLLNYALTWLRRRQMGNRTLY